MPPNAVMRDGDTALHILASNNEWELAEMIIEKKASVDIRDSRKIHLFILQLVNVNKKWLMS